MNYGIIPPGKATGCLPRKSHIGEWFPLASERVDIIPEDRWDELAAQITLRHFVKTVLDQDGVGSCAAEASVQALMIARAFAGLPHVVLNPWFVYHTTSGGVDGGSSIDENLRFLQDYGCAPESVWPRSKGWRVKPSDEAYEAAKKLRILEVYDVMATPEFVTCELLGHPVVWGGSGHAFCNVQHLNSREGLGVNSWGEGWGDGGFGVWLPYARINWGYGAWAVRVATEKK